MQCTAQRFVHKTCIPHQLYGCCQVTGSHGLGLTRASSAAASASVPKTSAAAAAAAAVAAGATPVNSDRDSITRLCRAKGLDAHQCGSLATQHRSNIEQRDTPQHLMQRKLLLDLPPSLLLLNHSNLLGGPRRKLAAEKHDVRLRTVDRVMHPPATRARRQQVGFKSGARLAGAAQATQKLGLL